MTKQLHRKILKTILLMAVTLSLMLLPFMAASAEADIRAPSATLTVGQGSGCIYSTLTAAIAAANDGDTIYISTSTLSSLLPYRIEDKSLTIVGGYNSDCLAPTRQRTTLQQVETPTLSALAPVFEVVNTNVGINRTVQLRNLNITNGDPATDGGGISAEGNLSLTLRNTHVYSNTSGGNGGGVSVKDGVLSLEEGSAIYDNDAFGHGGGIYCTGSVLMIDGSGVGALGGNLADADNGNGGGHGGGIYGSDCPMTIADSDIANNEARAGGGILATGVGTVKLNGSGARVIDNHAIVWGGGVWLAGFNAMDMSGGVVNDNSAESDAGGILVGLNASLNVDKELCASDACAQISGNRAALNGGGVYIQSGSLVDMNGVEMRGNSAESTGSAIASFGDLTLLNSIVSDGKGAAGAIRLNNPSTADVQFSTFAFNNLTSTQPTFTFQGGGSLNANAIINYGNGVPALFSGVPLSISQSNSILEAAPFFGTNNFYGDPVFVMNGPDGDYHIAAGSPAIDHLGVATGPGSDFDGETRPQGYPAVWDAGADEFTDFIGLNGAACGFATIADAVAAATGGDTVHIPVGQYNERIGEVGKDLSFVASEVDCSAEIISGNFNSVLIVGDGLPAVGSGGIVHVADNTDVSFKRISLMRAEATIGGIAYVGNGSSLTLDDARLSAGEALTGVGLGGGVYTLGDVILRNGSIITEGKSKRGGGAWVGTQGSLTLEDSSYIGSAGFGNDATMWGGGVYVAGSLTVQGTSKIEANTADNGGGVFAEPSANVQILSEAEALLNNIASNNGGGLYVYGSYPTVPTVMVGGGAIIRGNGALVGGAIYATEVDGLFFDNVTLDNNTATVGGGGIYIKNDLNFTGTPYISMNSVTVSGNSALDASSGGGGLWLAPMTSAYLTEVTFSENLAAGDGGAIQLSDSYAAITNTTFLANGAANGGAVSGQASTLVVNNTALFSKNTAMGNGGAVHLDAGSMTVVSDGGDVEVSSNVATGSGGGISAEGNTTLSMNAFNGGIIRLTDNEATVDGGAIHLSGNGEFSAEGNILVMSNSAGGGGGGIYQDGGDGALHQSEGGRPTIDQNKARFGGGLSITSVMQSSGTVAGDYIDGATVSNNSATASNGGMGGGLYVKGSQVNFTNIHIENNQAIGVSAAFGLPEGGGVAIGSGSIVAIDSSAACVHSLAPNRLCSEIVGNKTMVSAGSRQGSNIVEGVGGGVSVGLGTMSIKHTAVQDNEATEGGGIWLSTDTNALTLENSLVTGNSASYAVWIASGSTLDMRSTTVAHNLGEGVFVWNGNVVSSYQNNIVWEDDVDQMAGTFLATCSISFDGDAGAATDPLFVSPAAGNFRLSGNSPAIDACANGPVDDIVGDARPVDLSGGSATAYDMGAFELQSVPTAVALLGRGVSSAENPIALKLLIVLTLTAIVLFKRRSWSLMALTGMLVWGGVASVSAEVTPSGGVTRLVCQSPCGYQTIQDAVNASANGDSVKILDPVHTEQQIVIHQKTITIEGTGMETTLVQAANSLAESSGRVFDVTGGNFAVTFRNMTIQHGHTVENGGGIKSTGIVNLDRVRLRDNAAAGYGGGVSAFRLLSDDSQFISNYAALRGGGASAAGLVATNNRFVENLALEGGAAWSEGSLSISDSEVLANEAARGGGLVAVGGLQADNVSFENNVATEAGAAIYLDDLTHNSAHFVKHSSFLSNRVKTATADDTGGTIWVSASILVIEDSDFLLNISSSNGGAIQISSDANVTMRRSELRFNSAAFDGGAIYNQAVAFVSDTTIDSNQAQLGGGIAASGPGTTLSYSTVSNNSADLSGGGIHVSTGSSLTMRDSTVSGNQSDEHGGGLYFADDTTGGVIRSTVAFNVANANEDTEGAGGGIYREGIVGNVTMVGSIISDNQQLPGVWFSHAPDCIGTIGLAGYSLIFDLGTWIQAGAPCNVPMTPSLFHGIDPFLGELSDNGGPTKTHALLHSPPLFNSIAVDPGNPAPCVTSLQVPILDQRGAQRVGTCDLGAYEHGAVPTAVALFGAGAQLVWSPNAALLTAGLLLFAVTLSIKLSILGEPLIDDAHGKIGAHELQ